MSEVLTPPHDLPRHSAFRRLAQWTSKAVGTSAAFAIALTVVVGWALSGPLFHFSDTWQLVINTGTTVVTFLMIFLVQHTQNRETEAIRLQLDELIYAVHAARNEMLAIDEFSDEEIRRLREEFRQIAAMRRPPAGHPSPAGAGGLIEVQKGDIRK
ncbi:MAG: low affinity iron permease family protein [Myxococcales bacterium]|nr:low affinity iron permease family protein [Myxococcales bacterium]